MKTLIIYYSYSGKTKRIAEALAESESADIAEIKSVGRPVKLKVYTAGILATFRNKAWPIQPPDIDFSDYERLILMSPVWASNPPPYVTAMLEQLPEGKTVAVKMISASGKSECVARLEAALKARNCTLEGVEDIKAG